MSDKATIEYYKMINEEVNKKLGGFDIAEILIQSVNFGNIEYFIKNDKWDDMRDYLTKKAIDLEKGGADIVICASNTVHRALGRIEENIKIPFIHIIDPTAKAINKASLKKIVLLGTKATMQAQFVKDRYKSYGIEILVPSEEEMIDIDNIIFEELVKGEIKESSRKRYVEICQNLEKQGAQGVILGCTEIFLLIEQKDIPSMKIFDTTELHVKEVVKEIL